MVGEDCSWKGTFHLDRGFIFLFRLRLASSNFRKFVQISNLAYYFFLPKIFQISRIFDQKSSQTQEISVLKMQVNKVLNKASLVKSSSRHGEVWGRNSKPPMESSGTGIFACWRKVGENFHVAIFLKNFIYWTKAGTSVYNTVYFFLLTNLIIFNQGNIIIKLNRWATANHNKGWECLLEDEEPGVP